MGFSGQGRLAQDTCPRQEFPILESALTALDALPAATLPERYGVARSQVYNRLNALGLTMLKQGNKAYVNAAKLQQLNAIYGLITED